MKSIEQSAKVAAPTQTGRSATFRGLLPGQGSGAPARAVAAAVIAALCALAIGLLFASSALALTNPERHYEMVSPPYKAGYGVVATEAVASNGESVAFSAQGLFGGEPSYSSVMSYLARRGPAGWSTVPLDAPSSLAPLSSPTDFSGDLGATLSIASLGPNVDAAEKDEGDEAEFLLHSTETPDVAADWEVAGARRLTDVTGGSVYSTTEQGASDDLCKIIVHTYATVPLLQEAVGKQVRLYELDRGCDGRSPSLRVLPLDNQGAVIPVQDGCTAKLGADELGTRVSTVGEVSGDGNEVFFEQLTGGQCDHNATGTGTQLFVRLGGSRTLEVSKPIAEGASCVEVPCPGGRSRPAALFEGASEDGSRVFFTTTAPLTGDDADPTRNLYMASIGCPAGEEGCEAAQKRVTSLVQVSHDPTAGEAAEVQGVVRIAPDGARVYFVAQGVLSTAPNAEGRSPVKGAENLYVSDGGPEAAPVFVADLCSGPELSGSARDASCPSDLNEESSQGRNDKELWNGPPEAQSTADGALLVFATYGRLLSSDTDNAKDLYRYDATTGTLDRVSIGEDGADANGNRDEDPSEAADLHGARFADATIELAPLAVQASYEQREMGSRAISEDGSRVVFSTAEPLSSQATNGLTNVYEWHLAPGASEGSVSIISSGSSSTPDREAVISPSGDDVFFSTSAGLVSQDTDGLSDVYDARIGAGFPTQAAPPQECSGDACQGPLTNPAPLLVPGSVTQAPGESLAPPVVSAKAKPKAKPAACRKGFVKKKNKCIKKAKAKKASRDRRTGS